MVGHDQRDGTTFDLSHLRDPLPEGKITLEGNLLRSQPDWHWQRYVAERVRAASRIILGKGRQIGVTWVVLAVDVEEALCMPGTVSLLYRQRQDEAVDNVRRWWALYRSLPVHLTEHITVLRPEHGGVPGESGIMLRFPSGQISEVVPMTSAKTSGHGRSVRRVILDEAAHIEKLSEIRAAVEPAAGRAKIAVISTAAGRANPETGEGNEFHRMWEDEHSGYERIFLAYDVHPDRDEDWYATAPEVQSLKLRQRNEQFPRNAHEAFRLTANTYFDEEDLLAYAKRVRQPLKRVRWELVANRVARRKEHAQGPLRILVEPHPEHRYAIGADPSTGRMGDYSAAYVIDLATMEFAAEYHARIDPDLFARDLHFLGRHYNTAEIAVETQGGFGESVIANLRDGKAGRSPYPKLYRHLFNARPDLALAKPFGFPMTSKSRPLAINALDKAIREGVLPFVTDGLLHEMENFISEPAPDSRKQGPWPRAADGFHDDRVMAACIALELYRQKGTHPDSRKPRRRRRETPYTWMHPLTG